MLVPVKDLNSASEIYRHVKELKRKMAQSEAAAKLAISKAEALRLRRMSEAEAERERRRLVQLEERKRLEKEAWERVFDKAEKAMEAHIQTVVAKAEQDGKTVSPDEVREMLLYKETPAKFVIRRCDELGMEPGIVLGHGRSAHIVKIRHMLIWETHKQFPNLSYPQLGTLFGGRDHTSIMYACKKMEFERQGKKFRRGMSIKGCKA